MPDRLCEIKNLLSDRLRGEIFNEQFPFQVDYCGLEEIRLRCMQPVSIRYMGKDYLARNLLVQPQDISQSLEYMSNYSLYAFQEEIKQGYLTVKGGHRIGVLGRAVIENGSVTGQNMISFINIRVAHEWIGCADSIMDFVCRNNKLEHTLIISPPCCGKTTLLRDIVRQLSQGKIIEGKKVCVIDERSEIAACVDGIPQNKLGPRTDVIDCCPKAEGMLMVIRAMSPDVVAVDEIGGEKDIEAIDYIINCGCIVIGTVHGLGIEELYQKPRFSELLNRGVFGRIIVLSGLNGAGTISECRELSL